MATTVRSSSSNQATTGTAISVTAPTGTTTGDVVVIAINGNNNTTIADNNGSTPFTADISNWSPNTVGGQTMSIYLRTIQTGDPTTYNFTLGTTGRWAIVAVTFQNPQATFYDVAPSTANGINLDNPMNQFTIDCKSITTQSNNAIHIALCMIDGPINITGFPAGYTTEQNTTQQPIAFSDKVIATAGATGIQTFTVDTNSADGATLSFSIKGETITATTPQIPWYTAP
jgi:hypothetical protein